MYVTVYSGFIHNQQKMKNKPNGLQLVNGQTNCDISIQWNIA